MKHPLRGNATSRATPRRALHIAFLSLGLWLLIAAALPPEVAARCFGVPEEGPGPRSQGAWSLKIEVTSSNGFRDSATLGIDPNATGGFDSEFDAVEPLFLFVPRALEVEFTLYAYFFYPENPETAVGSTLNPEATVGLTTSVVGPRENVTWPLQLAYLYQENALLSLNWEVDQTRALEGYTVEMFTPSGEVIVMDRVSNYSFHASPGIHDFTVRALSQGAGSAADLGLIIAALVAYALAVAAVAVLRYRKRRG